MLLIGENIHIISKKTKIAIQEKNSAFIKNLAQKQKEAGITCLDLNIGPARKQEGVMQWLIETVQSEVDCDFSLDTTNFIEMESGLKLLSNKPAPIINSTSGDPDRLDKMMTLAAKYNSKIIGLTMDDISGIPKTSDERLEIAMRIVEKAQELDIKNENIYLDPLILPVNVSQSQSFEALNSIRVFREAFDPPVNITVGLSNISNSSPNELRGLINRVYLVLAMGCGLNSAIVDSFDSDLKHYVKIIETGQANSDTDKLILSLYNMMQEFGELDDIKYNSNDPEQLSIYKTAQILLNKNIYAHNYLNV